MCDACRENAARAFDEPKVTQRSIDRFELSQPELDPDIPTVPSSIVTSTGSVNNFPAFREGLTRNIYYSAGLNAGQGAVWLSHEREGFDLIYPPFSDQDHILGHEHSEPSHVALDTIGGGYMGNMGFYVYAGESWEIYVSAINCVIDKVRVCSGTNPISAPGTIYYDGPPGYISGAQDDRQINVFIKLTSFPVSAASPSEKAQFLYGKYTMRPYMP